MFAKTALMYRPLERHRALALALVSCACMAACAPTPGESEAVPQAPAPADSTDAASNPAALDPAAQATASAPGSTPHAPGHDPAGETIGGDGSQIQLDALTAQDVSDARLSGELACSFAAPDATSLLHATGVVAADEPAQGVVKVSGYVEPVRAPGGFNAIVGGATFTGQGKTIVVALTGPAIGGGESPPRPATLTYQRADGASRVFAGQWQCGP